MFLYHAASGHVYRISFLVLWSWHFDFRVASDDLMKKRRREVHVVESALATAMGVHSAEGRRDVVFDLPSSAVLKPCNVADPLFARLTVGYVQYQVTALQRTLSFRDLARGLLSGVGAQWGWARPSFCTISVVQSLRPASLLTFSILLPISAHTVFLSRRYAPKAQELFVDSGPRQTAARYGHCRGQW